MLFEELKLPSTKKTPGGEQSTDSEVLEELALKHRLPRLIIEHRQLAKLKSTYLDALPGLADPDGRIHASFNQGVAATGRLSSSDPNLQNIPIRTETGSQIRQAFVAGFPGWSLLTADYSQIELRVLAHYSEDPALMRAFAEDHDIHTVVAAQIFRVAESDVDAVDAPGRQDGQFRRDLRPQRRSAWRPGWGSRATRPARSSRPTSANMPGSMPSSPERWKRPRRAGGSRRSSAAAGRSTASRTRPAGSATSPSGPPSTP